MTPAEQFREVIHKELGVAPAVIIGDGKTRRFSTNGSKRDDAGEYRFFDDRFPAGFAKDYRRGIYFTWSARDDATVLSEPERAERAKIIRDREQRRQREQAEAARIAQQRWQKAKAAAPAHPYLTRKGVQAHGLRQEGEALLVAVMDGDELISVQSIAPDGSKLFQLGARVKGGFFTIGDASDVIYVAEGFATGATIHELTGQQTVIAFNAGNLLPVAQKVRANYPEAHIVICGDDDFANDKNLGVAKATEAAKIINGYLAIPPFERDKGEVGTDFNDLAALHGSRAVQDALAAALDVGTLKDEEASIYDEALPKEPPGFFYPVGEAAPTPTRKMKLEWFSAAAELGLSESNNPLIEGTLDEGALSVIYGDSNSGKTFIALDMAHAVATGREWNGNRTRRGLVIYVAAEGGRRITRRIAALKRRHEGEEPLFALIRYPIDLRSSDANAKELLALIREAERQCGELCVWIIVDTLSRAMAGGDENSPVDMGRIVVSADFFRAETGAHLTYVHHTGKDTARGARGHSLLRAATDTEIEVSAGAIRATKQRDMECGAELGFALIDEILGEDSSGRTIKTAVVEWSAAKTTKVQKAERPVPAAQRLLMEVIADALKESGEDIRPSSDWPIVRAVAEQYVRSRYFDRIAAQPREGETRRQLFDRQRKSFERSLDAALRMKLLLAASICEERFLWIP